MPRQRHAFLSLLLRLLCAFWLGVAGLLAGRPLPVVYAAGTITGTVFQDFNQNGVRDVGATIPNSGAGTTGVAVDQGVGGVTVTAYDASGAVVGAATTAADGTYTVNAAGTGPYRIEFANLPAGYYPGPQGVNNGTTVRFVPDGNSSNVDLGIALPTDYCSNNPQVATNCYVFGDQIAGPYNTNKTLVTIPYSAGSTSTTNIDQPTTHATMLLANQVGTTWGLAWARSTRRLYAASFMKKHAGFGPGADGAINTLDDPGAIYVIDPSTNAVVNTFTVPNATTNAHDTANYLTDNFNTGWDAVGKTALGGLAISADDTTLYVMNLQDRALYALSAATGAVISSQTVPLTPPLLPPATIPTCPSSDVRPFAVTYYNDNLYVGMVCSAESSATVDTFTDSNANGRYDVGEPFVDNDGNTVYTLQGDARQLQAYVYQVNPATLTFSASPVFQVVLNYPRGLMETGCNGFAEWQPWVVGFNGTVGSCAGLIMYPQPWLTKIVFDNGNLILGLRDRLGDIAGANSPEDPANPVADRISLSGGETLRACGNPTAGWTLESNGRCGGLGTAPQNTNQGPGNGEYYFEDYYIPFHEELSVGGLLQIPGFPSLVVTVYDPAFPSMAGGTFDGGMRWFTNSTGAFQKAYRLFDGSNGTYPGEPAFGKAASLGDLVALCEPAPIEIGNLVWLDTNDNGVQDPGEAPLAGVTVRLYDAAGNLVATTTTNASGEYYFNNANVPGGLQSFTSYQIRLDNPADYAPGGPLAGLFLTPANQGPGQRDSNGTVVGGFPVAPVTTGGPGANDHTFDFGFSATAPTATPTPTPTTTPAAPQTATLPPGPSATTPPPPPPGSTATAVSGGTPTPPGFSLTDVFRLTEIARSTQLAAGTPPASTIPGTGVGPGWRGALITVGLWVLAAMVPLAGWRLVKSRRQRRR